MLCWELQFFLPLFLKSAQLIVWWPLGVHLYFSKYHAERILVSSYIRTTWTLLLLQCFITAQTTLAEGSVTRPKEHLCVPVQDSRCGDKPFLMGASAPSKREPTNRHPVLRKQSQILKCFRCLAVEPEVGSSIPHCVSSTGAGLNDLWGPFQLCSSTILNFVGCSSINILPCLRCSFFGGELLGMKQSGSAGKLSGFRGWDFSSSLGLLDRG